MNVANERSLAHAQAMRARGAALPPDGMPSSDILDSWVRCTRAQLDMAASPVPWVIDANELARRRQRADPVRRLALAEIETLMQQIAGSNFLLAFADPEGVILDLVADNRFEMSGKGAGIVTGSCWSEAVCGTNALGTALATGRSVAVNGLEHFFFEHGNISCAAAPIRDARGEVAGLLDASSYVGSRQRHTQALVQMAATHVENLLLVQQMRGHRVIAIHPRAEFLATLSCGLIAFDAEGRISAVNARARGFLVGLELACGTPFESLFDESFERFSGRCGLAADLRLCDVLGSTLIARCIQAPRAASPAEWLRTEPPPTRERARRAEAAERLRDRAQNGPDMVADDPAVAEALRLAEAAVRMRVAILVQGETGTGKELLARHAHRSSGRSGAFVAVNCGALPAELVEAELFGHVGGAYTGARREGGVGLIASADGGTLLLDEIGELPMLSQAALLRFLDDQQVRPVGGTRSRRVDVQVLAATHADLEAEVAARRFRADLWHRLNTVQIVLPPLRTRSDFAALARSVLHDIDPGARVSDAALALLSRMAWRGNLRELRAALTRALLMSPGGVLEPRHFEHLPAVTGLPAGASSALQQATQQRVQSEFERCGRSVSQTSRNLGVSRTTVYRYLREQAARSMPSGDRR